MPPFDVGTVHARPTDPLPNVGVRLPGAEAGADGVTGADSAEKSPVPAAFRAATRNTYAVPFVSPVTVAASVALVPSANVCHGEPGTFVRYWTT